MHRQFIATVLVTALAVASLGAAPARADGKDAAKIIAGAVALGLIGAAIAEHRGRDDGAVSRRHRGGFAHDKDRHRGTRAKERHRHDRYRGDRYHRGDHRDGYRHGKRRKAALPRACRVYHHAEHGARYGYSGRCLRKHYAGYRGLPRRCAIVVGGQFGTIYRDKCLSGHGYGTGRR